MIDESLNNLITTIKNSKIYINYLHILKQVEKNNDINEIVNDIKNIQKEIVKEEHIHKKDTKGLEEALDKKKKELYSIPLYQDYIEASNELNDMMKQVNKRLQDYINGLDI